MMKVPTDVSVVIPTFNSAHLLPDCIESILAQTVLPQEIIIVDDGSSDNTEEAVRRYGHLVTYIRQENGGCGAARNTGSGVARCEWIAFLDADDRWLPQKQELQLACAQANPSAGLIYCDALLTGPHSRSGTFLSGHRPFNGRVFDQLLDWCFLIPSMAMLRKDALMDVGGFRNSTRNVEDYDLWLRLARKYEFYAVAAPLVLYDRQENSISKFHAAMARSESQILMELLATGLSTAQQEKVRRRLARRFFELSYEVRKSNPRESIHAAFHALRLLPSKPDHWMLMMKNLCWMTTSLMPGGPLKEALIQFRS